jgi:hypothetical protein
MLHREDFVEWFVDEYDLYDICGMPRVEQCIYQPGMKIVYYRDQYVHKVCNIYGTSFPDILAFPQHCAIPEGHALYPPSII